MKILSLNQNQILSLKCPPKNRHNVSFGAGYKDIFTNTGKEEFNEQLDNYIDLAKNSTFLRLHKTKKLWWATFPQNFKYIKIRIMF